MNVQGFTVLALAGATAAIAVPGAARAVATEPAVAPAAQVEVVTLKNGLRLLLAPDARAAGVDMAVWYDSGTRHENAGATGMAHLFEHLMFHGSEDFGPQQHQRLVEAEGGTAGAATAADYTTFFQTLPADALELAFRLEADRMRSLRLGADDLAAERQQIRAEVARRFESTPMGRALQSLYASVFRDHPYGRPVLGLEADLDRLTLDQARAWYQARYAPARALVTVVGRFERARALELARRWLEPVRRSGTAVASPPGPRQTAERRTRVASATQVPLLLLGWRGPAPTNPDLAALQVLSNVLGRGTSARLRRELVERDRVAVLVQSELDARRDASVLHVAVAASPKADSAALERRVLAEIERLATEPVSVEELERGKNLAESAMLFSWQGTRGRAQALGAAQMLAGDHRDAARQLERVRAVSAADLQRAAARWLGRAQLNLIWVGTATPGGAPAGSRP
jgi:zinc protease